MNPKQSARVTSVASPVLGPDERVEVTSFANVRQSGPPRGFYLALTSARLLFFGVDALSGRPEKKLALSLPRRSLRPATSRRGLFSASLALDVAGDGRGLRLVFPRPSRADAGALADALATPPADPVEAPPVPAAETLDAPPVPAAETLDAPPAPAAETLDAPPAPAAETEKTAP